MQNWLMRGAWWGGLLMAGAAIMASGAGDIARGAEPLVFISAFADGDDAAIHAFRFDAARGELQPVARTTGVAHPFFLALSPDQRFLYSIHAEVFSGKENEHVAAYELEGRTGKLKLLNRQSALGTAACYLQVDATGQTLLLANYTSGSVASFPIQADGKLGEAATFVQHAGSSVNPARQKEPHAHCFVTSPDNRYAYAADLGIDQIVAYRLDAAAAKIVASEQPFVRTIPGAGPRHLTFHPQGKWMYVINELANSVTHFDYNSTNGSLTERATISTLPGDFTGISYCADLKITPDGRFLYGTNRGHDSLAAYRIDAAGRLTLLEIVPSLGKGPQNLLITPDGKWLLCANMPGNNVAVFRIEAETGKLTPHGTPIAMPGPSCIQWLR
ncbi:MAG: lactonase family protein [Pirellulales bacterium]